MSISVFIIFVLFYYTTSHSDFHHSEYESFLRAKGDESLDLNETFFGLLRNYHVNVKTATENMYPWIARVIHSRKNNVPYLCTASCIDPKIFITAARCVTRLKVKYTIIIYQKMKLSVKALVLPTEPTKQFYDDIGFIVTNREFTGKWETIDYFKKPRTDNLYNWFEAMNFSEEYKVVGYTKDKSSFEYPPWHNKYMLTELTVVVNLNLCRNIFTYYLYLSGDGFRVPCYHSCTSEQFQDDDYACDSYHGVEGGALYKVKNKELLGIATWGTYGSTELPVGIAIPNSANYFEDFICAKVIRDYRIEKPVEKGFYQNLCEDSKIKMKKL